jgi:predicted RNase H-like HicB family nuclease
MPSRSVFPYHELSMGMARAESSDSDPSGREIRLVEEEDGRWSAIDEHTGVASQGETRSEALANLDEAVALHTGEIGKPVTDADLRDLGLDPESVPDEPGEPDAPWFSE